MSKMLGAATDRLTFRRTDGQCSVIHNSVKEGVFY